MSFFDRFKSSPIKEFSKRALKGPKPEPITIDILEIDKVYYGIALPLRKKGWGTSSDVIAFVDAHLSGRCPKCDTYIQGADLTNAAAMKDAGSSMVFAGGSGPTQRLSQGFCPNEKCGCTEVTLYWAI